MEVSSAICNIVKTRVRDVPSFEERILALYLSPEQSGSRYSS